MQTATATTCAELYDCDPTFAAGIAAWVADRRCPVALGDWLEEAGFPAAADCARWANEEADRQMAGGGRCGAFPWPDRDNPARDWYWFYSDGLNHCNCVPEASAPDTRRNGMDAGPVFPTPAEAILWLLDNFRHRAEGTA